MSDAPDRPDVQRWIKTDCFETVGITTPEAAMEHPGCAVLVTQYRFGDGVTALANAVAYDGVLRRGDTGSADDADIVLIDTDQLGDLGMIRRTKRYAGWWPAGSLLARALAEHHRYQGETVGIAAPYGAQVQATLETIRDVEGPSPHAGTEVGTVHRLQGREFDVVVLDLMEDGPLRPGWISQAHHNGGEWLRDGVRLFNVGVTRPKGRLYLIGSRSAVTSRKAGPLLREVQRLINDGRIRVVDGAHLLGLAPDTAVVGDHPVYAELEAAFGKFVRTARIDDEHSFFETLRQYLSAARDSVWIWAPWVRTRARQLLPLLEQTAQRAEVVIFTRGGEHADLRWLRELESVAHRVVRYHNMHQKIVVIDERVTLMGSLNVLSHAGERGGTHDIMVVHEGRGFAKQVLRHEHAELLSKPPRTSKCRHDETAEVWRSPHSSARHVWCWSCPTCNVRWPVVFK